MENSKELYRLFGELLEYPKPGLLEKARRCRELMVECRPEGAGLLDGFLALVGTAPPGTLEELYTGTFDLNPTCCPYVGYQLVGEDPKRAALMLKLQEEFHSTGFSTGNELPDHIAVLLRFLAWQKDGALQQELVELLLLPALQKMVQPLDEKNLYGQLLRAVASVMSDE